MEDVVRRSGLNKSIFHDLRGNHDNFGVSSFGGPSDFFSKYSLNGQLGRKGPVDSIIIQVIILFAVTILLLQLACQLPRNLIL